MSPIGEQQRPKAKSSNGPRQTKYQKGKTKNYAETNHDYTPGSPPAETQNVPSHKIFVFGPADDDLMDIENGAIELTEIRSRNRKDHITRPKGTTRNDAVDELRKIHFIDHDVDPEDSLAKLSLKYGCTVSHVTLVLKMLVLFHQQIIITYCKFKAYYVKGPLTFDFRIF